jgi:hypothetical protein
VLWTADDTVAVATGGLAVATFALGWVTYKAVQAANWARWSEWAPRLVARDFHVEPRPRGKPPVGGVLPHQIEGLKGPFNPVQDGGAMFAAQANLELVSEGRSTAMTYLYPSAGVEVMEATEIKPDGGRRPSKPVVGAYMVQPGWSLLVSLLQWKSVSEWASDYDASGGRYPGSLGRLRVRVRSTVDPLEDNTEFEFGRLVLVRSGPKQELYTNTESGRGALGHGPDDVTVIGSTKRTEHETPGRRSFLSP